MVLAWQCQKWRCLPEAGGLLDQDAVLMSQMNHALAVYNAVNSQAHAENLAEWATANPDLALLALKVRQLKNG